MIEHARGHSDSGLPHNLRMQIALMYFALWAATGVMALNTLRPQKVLSVLGCAPSTEPSSLVLRRLTGVTPTGSRRPGPVVIVGSAQPTDQQATAPPTTLPDWFVGYPRCRVGQSWCTDRDGLSRTLVAQPVVRTWVTAAAPTPWSVMALTVTV